MREIKGCPSDKRANNSEIINRLSFSRIERGLIARLFLYSFPVLHARTRPTLFTIFGHQNPLHDVTEQHKISGSTDLEALKL